MPSYSCGKSAAPVALLALGITAIGLVCQSPRAHQGSVNESVPALSDSADDGTPDFLRLDTEEDQRSFRRWFTFLAEVQFFTPAKQRTPEIRDCAALLRYCYREALRSHDSAWAAQCQLLLLPAAESVRKYQYPFTPLRANLFRLQSGPFTPGDLNAGRFGQFANAKTLREFNTFLVSRDVKRASPGDLLFYRRVGTPAVYHSMIFIGRSQITPSPFTYVVYNTGPEGASEGEMRRLTISDLMQFPDPQWRPIAANPQFLGVYRWNILRYAR
jgi:uncharacterized protein YfaT (DUF1175 family)